MKYDLLTERAGSPSYVLIVRSRPTTDVAHKAAQGNPLLFTLSTRGAGLHFADVLKNGST